MKAAEKVTYAYLKVLDFDDTVLTLKINPSDLSLNRQANWNVQDGDRGKTAGHLYFDGVQPDEMDIKVLFDETVLGDIELANASGFAASIGKALATVPRGFAENFGLTPKKNENSILPDLHALYKLTTPHIPEGDGSDRLRPPVLLFVWNKIVFLGVIESLKTEVLVMTADGVPKRATVDVSFKGQALTSEDDHANKVKAEDFSNLSFSSKTNDLQEAFKNATKGKS